METGLNDCQFSALVLNPCKCLQAFSLYFLCPVSSWSLLFTLHLKFSEIQQRRDTTSKERITKLSILFDLRAASLGKDIHVSRAAWWHKTSSSSSAWAGTGSLWTAHTHTPLLAASTAEERGAAVTACRHMPKLLAVMWYQAWRIAHPPVRGQTWLGSRPLVHVGFLKSWLAGGLKLKVVNKVLEAVQHCKQHSTSDGPVTVLVTGEAMTPFPLAHQPMPPASTPPTSAPLLMQGSSFFCKACLDEPSSLLSTRMGSQ